MGRDEYNPVNSKSVKCMRPEGRSAPPHPQRLQRKGSLPNIARPVTNRLLAAFTSCPHSIFPSKAVSPVSSFLFCITSRFFEPSKVRADYVGLGQIRLGYGRLKITCN